MWKLCDCEIFGNLCLIFVWSFSRGSKGPTLGDHYLLSSSQNNMRFSGGCSNSLRHQVPNYTYWSHQATAECHCCVRHIIQLATRPPRYPNIVMLTRHGHIGHTGHPPGGHQHCQHCHGQHLANTSNRATEINITKVNKHHHNRKDGSVWRMVLLWLRSMSTLWSCL